MSRVFLSMTDEEACALDAAREKVGMTKSQYPIEERVDKEGCKCRFQKYA